MSVDDFQREFDRMIENSPSNWKTFEIGEEMPNLAERYLVPRERRTVDLEAAAKLRAVVSRLAKELGFDKVTAAVVLADYAVELLRSNHKLYEPAIVREVFERAIVVHYANARGRIGP